MPETNLGPVVSLASAERIRKQVQDAGTIILFLTSQIVVELLLSCQHSPGGCEAVDS